MKIVINYDALSKQGVLVKEMGTDLEMQINNLLLKVEELGDDWKGNDSRSYIETMKEKIILELQKVYPLIEEYGEYAKNVAEAYKMLDDNFANKKIEIR